MAIEFACHQCGGHFAAPEQLAGKQAKCKRCGAIVSVPIDLSAEPARTVAPRAGSPGKTHVVKAIPAEPRQPVPAAKPTQRPAPQPAPLPFDLSDELPQASSPRTSPYTLRPAATPRAAVPWPLIIGFCALVILATGVVGAGMAVLYVWPLFAAGSTPAKTVEPPTLLAPPPTVKDSLPPAPSSIVSPTLTNLPTAPAERQEPKAEESPQPVLETTWLARSDPPAAPVTYKEGKLAIQLPSNVNLLLPHGPSHFILGMVSEARREAWQVFDLRTGKEIGKTIEQKLNIDRRTTVFSPDGRYLAAVTTREFGTSEVTIGIWSFATGQMVQVLRVPTMFFSVPIRFAGPHQLVTLHDEGWKSSVLTLWDLQTGSIVRRIHLPNELGKNQLREESLAVSPGGRYAAVVLGNQLGVVDLTTGEPAGVALLPEAPWSCDGAMFSPDGAELALMLRTFTNQRLVIVDFGTGNLTLDHDYRGRLPAPRFGYNGPPLDWLPDKRGLVFAGHLLLERTTGEEVWVFPETDTSPRRFLPNGQILVMLGSRNGRALQTADVPEKEIARLIQSIRDGGSAVDSVLPPLTTANLFSAVPTTLPTGPSQYTFAPDPAGPMPKGLEREVLIAKGDETIRRIGFAGPASGKVVVQKEITPWQAVVGRRQPRRAVLERYDLASGDKGNTVEVPYVYEFADVSPSGKSVIVAFAEKGNNYERLDVLTLSPKKHIAAWRPYAGERAPAGDEKERRFRSPRLWGLPDSPTSLVWAALLDEEHVLTVNTAGKLICWRLPDCQAVYVCEEFGEPLALSPSRRYLAGNHFGEFRLFDAASGKCVGDLESPRYGSRAVRAVFRADAQELAAIIDAGPDTMLVRWNLKDGKLVDEMPIPPKAVAEYVPFRASSHGARLGLEYRGAGHVMIDDTYLADLTKRAVAWQYHVTGFFATNSPDHRTWYCTTRPNSPDKSLFLTAQDTPSSLVLQKAGGITLDRQLVLQPGMSVRLQVDLGGAGFSEMNASVENAVKEGLELRGLKVETTADFVFSVVAAERSTGKEILVFSGQRHWSPFFRDPRDAKASFSQQELVVRLAVSNSAGKVLWHRDRSVQMAGFGQVRSDQDAGQQVREGMLRGFASLLASSGAATEAVPRYIFADLSTIIAGASTLGFHQEGPPPQVKLPENGENQKQPPGIAPGT